MIKLAVYVVVWVLTKAIKEDRVREEQLDQVKYKSLVRRYVSYAVSARQLQPFAEAFYATAWPEVKRKCGQFSYQGTEARQRLFFRTFEFFLFHQSTEQLQIKMDEETRYLSYVLLPGGAKLRQLSWPEIVRNVPAVVWMMPEQFAQDVIVHLALGKSIRTHPAYRHFSRKMAHAFHTAPPTYQLANMTWAYCLLRAAGTTEEVLNALLWWVHQYHGTPARREKGRQIVPLAQWLTRQPLAELDLPSKTLLLDYICEEVREENFYPVKKKTLNQLLQSLEERQQATLKQAELRELLEEHGYTENSEWAAAPFQDWREWTDAGQYHIRELRTAADLVAEGHRMRHCIGDYVGSCVNGELSVWALRFQPQGKEAWKSLATISISKDGMMGECQGPCNVDLSAEYWGTVQQWLERERLKW
ncbi:MAG: PcfJ domain-containing protein [Bacteroidota bacterium]